MQVGYDDDDDDDHDDDDDDDDDNDEYEDDELMSPICALPTVGEGFFFQCLFSKRMDRLETRGLVADRNDHNLGIIQSLTEIIITLVIKCFVTFFLLLHLLLLLFPRLSCFPFRLLIFPLLLLSYFGLL